MSYQALYRTYRPRTFKDVIDQKHIVKTLKNAIKYDKVAHAYLFCGPRGTGKTTLAKIFAASINCNNLTDFEPCLECDNCKTIINGNNPDVYELDAASNNGTDDIRALRDSVKYMPSNCKKKVYIIDEVHMLSTQAFNALLKTLEEPPSYVVFILATTEPHKIPNTILSRCQRFDFKSISFDGIISRLKYITEKENINITDEALNKIALNAEGGMRDALSILDEIISYANNDITIKEVLEVCGNTSDETLYNLLISLHKHDLSSALDILNNTLKEGKEVPKITIDFINFNRDILLYKNNINGLDKTFFKTLSDDEILKEINSLEIFKNIDILNEALNQMKFSNQKKPYLEVALIKLSDILFNEENILYNKVSELENKINKLINRAPDEFSNLNNQNVNYKDTLKEENKIINDTAIDHSIDIDIIKENSILYNEVQDDDNYITIKEINDVLNNANKQVKEIIISCQNQFKLMTSNFVLNIFAHGKIVAATNNKFIIVLLDNGFCERVMKPLNYNIILEEIRKKVKIDEFYAISQNIWNEIFKDFKDKFNSGIAKPVLNEILIPVKKPDLKNQVETKDPRIDSLIEIFGDTLEIKE